MAAAPTSVGQDRSTKTTSPIVFDVSQPPVIEGFSPLSRAKEENFKDKFIRKTKENPFVPIGELHKTKDHLHKLHMTTRERDFYHTS